MRRERSGHHANGKAELFIRRFRQWIRDGSVLSLLRQFLESGVMVGYHLEETELGSPQGGVISPLIANVYLDAFDQFMKARGHQIVRYADDILILCGSRVGANNALRVARSYLEGELKLTVNATKTHIAHSDEGVKFLGMVIYTNYTRIQDKKVVKLKQWKKPGRLHRRLKQLGYRPPFQFIKMQSWRSAASPLAHHAIPNAYLHDELRLVDLTRVRTGITVPEFGVS